MTNSSVFLSAGFAEHPGGPNIILKYAVSHFSVPLPLLRRCAGDERYKRPTHTTHRIPTVLLPQGKDATEAFEPIHPPDTLDKYLDKSKHLGDVDMGTVAKEARAEDPEEAARLQRVEQKPLLSQCYNLFDFEAVARRIMKKTAWGYYSSAADDEIVRWLSMMSPCVGGKMKEKRRKERKKEGFFFPPLLFSSPN